MYIDFHTHNIIADSSVFSILSYSAKESISNTDLPMTLGLHPWDIVHCDIENSFRYIENMLQCKNILMIGECGLDKCKNIPMSIQEAVFERHILLSEKYCKPLVIHCVKAFAELVAIKKKHRPTQRWIVHGFANNINIANMLLAEGIVLSFGKNLFNPRSNATKVLPRVSDMSFFLETDDDDISIKDIYAKAAEILGWEINKLQQLQKCMLKEILN